MIIGFIDTGIDYTNKLFQKSTGQTRILSIWDQTDVKEIRQRALVMEVSIQEKK
ncbi:MAG: hypothetical protein ACLUR5_07740 [Eubacterium ventriosum]